MKQAELNNCKRGDGKFLFIIALLFIAIGLHGNNAQQQPKHYSVTLNYSEWAKYSDWLAYTMNRIRNSDLPSKEVAAMTDSLLIPMYDHINRQVGSQYQQELRQKADSAGAKKPDSTKVKKK